MSGNVETVTLKYLPWQMECRDALLAGCQFQVLACGARSGKDRYSANAMVEFPLRLCMERIEGEKRGEIKLVPRVNCWIVAPTKKLFAQCWDELKEVLPARLIVRENKQDGEIRLRGDISYKFKSADRAETLVGEGVDYLWMTEASRIRDGNAWNESLQARLQSPGRGPGGRGGVAMINGTPRNGKSHWYRQLWEQARACKDGSKREWNLPTTCNPEMVDRIATLVDMMPQRLLDTEIYAIWPDDDSKPFRDADVDAMIVDSGEPPTRPFQKGLDVARRQDETFGIVGSGREVVDGFRLKKKKLGDQVRHCQRIEEKYPGKWHVDATNNGGDFFWDALGDAIGSRNSVDGYDFHGARKVDLIDGLIYGIEQGQIKLRRDLMPADVLDELVWQLKNFECDLNDDGTVDYHGPGGRRDDGVIALALWWFKVQFGGRRVDTFDYMDLLMAIHG